ncbi:Hypothetical predicted protein [Marmota monax]|uniref:Uncharacterized protein n=1 Tax=Marmota monax TaxID=9995 RepID=A0A5E4ART8_MARMO|nr:Hypothetical predicted protein [Marmota monax]
MTQGKLSVANKAPGTEGQQQANGEKKEAPAVPSAPPSYEEATSGEGLKAGAFPPAPTAVPLHPSWAFVDPISPLPHFAIPTSTTCRILEGTPGTMLQTEPLFTGSGHHSLRLPLPTSWTWNPDVSWFTLLEGQRGLGTLSLHFFSPTCPPPVSLQLSVANKAPGTEGQQQANGEKKEAPAVPSAPPSYEEATSGEGLKAGAFPPAPTAVPLHPSWAFVDPTKPDWARLRATPKASASFFWPRFPAEASSRGWE